MYLLKQPHDIKVDFIVPAPSLIGAHGSGPQLSVSQHSLSGIMWCGKISRRGSRILQAKVSVLVIIIESITTMSSRVRCRTAINRPVKRRGPSKP